MCIVINCFVAGYLLFCVEISDTCTSHLYSGIGFCRDLCGPVCLMICSNSDFAFCSDVA